MKCVESCAINLLVCQIKSDFIVGAYGVKPKPMYEMRSSNSVQFNSINKSKCMHSGTLNTERIIDKSDGELVVERIEMVVQISILAFFIASAHFRL